LKGRNILGRLLMEYRDQYDNKWVKKNS
jgi:hypothetical protein